MIEYGIVKLDTETQKKTYVWGVDKWKKTLKLLFEILMSISHNPAGF